MRKQILGILLSVAALISCATVNAAVLAQYGFTGNAVTSSDTDINSLASDFATSGISDTSGTNTFDFTDADADAGDFLLFSLTPDSGYTLDLASLSFTAQRSAAQGSVTIEARSSVDNYSSLLSFSAPLPVSTSQTLSGTSLTAYTIDLSDVAFDAIGSGGITFHLYFTGSNNSAVRYTSVDNVIVDGTSNIIATPVQLPAAAWLMGSGLLGMIGLSRRKQI